MALSDLATAADAMVAALKTGKAILVCGNGGSFAQAQHFAAELVGHFEKPGRIPLPCIALGSNPAALTAIANDDGYDKVFAREVDAYTPIASALLAISTSGRSRNVVEAVQTARFHRIPVVGLTGKDSAAVGEFADITIRVNATETAAIQDLHHGYLHQLCRLIEKAF